ncbi:transposase [Streptomyces sp. NBC_01185]|uniref:transposase n=1 Tax=Streptomyces sp. NBC_01185 TaxID=2903764 RepID=UPI003868E359|nr:IS110 family transposase [Streptomyces sp. NBC_01185]
MGGTQSRRPARSGDRYGWQPLITAGDNPDRLRSEASFARLCAAAPVPASSGRTNPHRVNRGGDRNADSALYTSVLVRMRHDQRTRDYAARRTTKGMSAKDIMRCLRRFVAREVYRHLRSTGILNTAGAGGAGS